jgi:hypothetical protein
MQLDFPILIAIWLFVIGVVSFASWKRRDKNIGGILTFVIFLAMIHLLQAIIYTFPWYQPYYDPTIVLNGFTQATIAMIAFSIGALGLFPALRHFNSQLQRSTLPIRQIPFSGQDKLAYLYILIGIISYFGLGLLLRGIPSAQAFTNALMRLWHVGAIIWLWEIIQHKRPLKSLVPLAAVIIIWPIFTVVRDGFLGFGVVPTIVVGIFAALRVRKVRLLIIPSLVISYVVLSIIAVYFDSRNTVRAIVWAGEYTQSPLQDVYNTLAFNFRWFDATDSTQLDWIDVRLGYNFPLGRVIKRIGERVVPLGNGQTIESAVLMLVPRALWPDKPIVVGGSALYQYYTGIPIQPGTSVGLSPVIELYANYQTPGVILGFILLGVVIAWLDYGAAQALWRGDNLSFALWIVPIFGLILVQDDLLTLVSTAVSGVISILVVNVAIRTVFAIRERKITSMASTGGHVKS